MTDDQYQKFKKLAIRIDRMLQPTLDTPLHVMALCDVLKHRLQFLCEVDPSGAEAIIAEVKSQVFAVAEG